MFDYPPRGTALALRIADVLPYSRTTMNTTLTAHRKLKKVQIIKMEDAASVHSHVFDDFSAPHFHDADPPDEHAMHEETAETLTAEQEMIPLEDAELQVQESYDRGFADGQQVTSALLDTEMNTMREWMKNLDTAMIDLREQFAQQIDEMEKAAIRIAMTAVEHILARELSDNSHVAVEQVRKALATLHGVRDVTVRVHPDSVTALTDAKNSLMSGSPSVQHIHITGDFAVEPGGCLLETAIGTVDAQLSTQLAHIRAAMEEAVRLQSNED
ncbi:MAG: hypothetical protein JNL32_01625 [Candidatus Kapabacteria bacterium]|nr:hypothetical protein [Candidatus Kapabacteria bacterium]